MDILPIVLLYILASAIVIFGIMFLIRRKREKSAGLDPSHKIQDLREEEIREKSKDE